MEEEKENYDYKLNNISDLLEIVLQKEDEEYYDD